jgi:hypothetical protein
LFAQELYEGPSPIQGGHPADPCTGPYYGRSRTAHIQVNTGTFLGIKEADRLSQVFRIRAHQLVYQPLRTGAGIKIPGFKGPPAYEGAGAYHFSKIFITIAENFDKFPKGSMA